MPHLPTFVLHVLDPRGRCNRKGLLLAAAILLAMQAVFAFALWGAGLDLASPVVQPVNLIFCWVAFLGALTSMMGWLTATATATKTCRR